MCKINTHDSSTEDGRKELDTRRCTLQVKCYIMYFNLYTASHQETT